MPFLPFQILGIWLRGLLGIAILAGGIALLRSWYDHCQVTRVEPAGVAVEPPREPGDLRPPADVAVRREFRFQPGMNRETAYLAAGLGLMAWALLGLWIASGLLSTLGVIRPASGPAEDEPRDERSGEIHRIARPDGSVLQVECYGPSDAPPIVFTHGWGCHSAEWFYPKRSLTDRFRVIVWDEPGLGRSKPPQNRDYRLEKLAADLDAVLTFVGDRPAVLVGHSIGGMIALTFCRTHHESLARRVAGLVLAHTTYTNPVRTTRMAAFYTAIEKPVLIPLLYVTIALWPLVWLMNWIGYLNGSTHRSTHRSSFAGNETAGQLDLAARFGVQARPNILARGMLGMLAYDATGVLPSIPVPTLVVVGDRDETTLPEAGEFISQQIPDAHLATLAPARHLGLIEQHARFDALVGDFAASCLGADARR